MRVPALMVLALLALLAPACKSHKPITVDTSEAGEIPREVALQKLRDLLPTAEYLYCTAPKETLKAAEVKTYAVRNDMIEIEFSKGRTLQLAYAAITEVNLELKGKYYTARVFSSAQPEAGREHFGFQWKQEERARQAVELLTALKKK